MVIGWEWGVGSGGVYEWGVGSNGEDCRKLTYVNCISAPSAIPFKETALRLHPARGFINLSLFVLGIGNFSKIVFYSYGEGGRIAVKTTFCDDFVVG